MEYRHLGNTGLRVSELCLGSMQFGWTANEQVSLEVLSAAYNAGINFIDTADIYSIWVAGNPGGVSETIIGKWMRQVKIPRERLVIATKVRGQMGEGPNDAGLSRKHIMQSIEGSLKRLQTDYIDLYQTHFFDEDTPIEETLSAFSDLIHQGKVRYIGCSNYPAWRLMQSLWIADKFNMPHYDCVQPHYNLALRDEFERELADICRVYRLGVIPYSPLARGLLTGKYHQEKETQSARASQINSNYPNVEKNKKIIAALDSIARQRGKTLSQVALGWLLSNPLITSPIIGARNLEQLKDNLGAAGFHLTDEEKSLLNVASDWR